MLKTTLKIVSYLLFSLLIGVIVTLVTDKIENVAVEKRIRKTVENTVKNSVSSFKESAARPTSHDEKIFVKKFVAGVMKEKVTIREAAPGSAPEADTDGLYLFTLKDDMDCAIDLYIKKNYLKSELAILDVPDYLSGITATIVIFSFIVFYAENKKRTLLMQHQFEVKRAELDSALEQNKALALLGRMSAALAHELKTPIATISNLVQTFPSRQSEQQFVKRFLALIRDEINRTQQLIDNLLAYGKDIDIPNNEWTPFEALFKVEAPGDIVLDAPQKFMIYGDKFYLGLLFKNIVRNSREAGANKIMVRVNLPTGNPFAEIICEDDGAGFSPTADIEKLPEPFVTSRSRGGGLGLYLAKKIAAAHGGSLALARMEKGARVVITFPVDRLKI